MIRRTLARWRWSVISFFAVKRTTHRHPSGCAQPGFGARILGLASRSVYGMRQPSSERHVGQASCIAAYSANFGIGGLIASSFLSVIAPPSGSLVRSPIKYRSLLPTSVARQPDDSIRSFAAKILKPTYDQLAEVAPTSRPCAGVASNLRDDRGAPRVSPPAKSEDLPRSDGTTYRCHGLTNWVYARVSASRPTARLTSR